MPRLLQCVITAIVTTAVICFSFAPLVASAEEGAEVYDQYPPKQWTISPAAEPQPALKYHLLPPRSERKPGNAATYYYRALLMNAQLPREHKQAYADNEERWSSSPLDEATRQELRDWLDRTNNVIEAVTTATHREYCEWDLRMQDIQGIETIAFLLPDAQESRDLARILSMRAHLEIEERRYDDALKTLQMGYQLGIDVGRELTLIHGLIGVAICGITNYRTTELMASPGSPNLYWALAELPNPIVDLRPQLRYEAQLGPRIFSVLRDAETAQRTPEQWRELLFRSFEDLNAIDSGVGLPKSPLTGQLMMTAMVARGYPTAKQGLIDMGFNRDVVERMPVGQVIAIYSARTYQRISDELMKWTELPFWMAVENMSQSNEIFAREGFNGTDAARREVLPIASLLLPAIQAACTAQARTSRDMAAMQTVESIRTYMAGHEGKLPASLDELSFPAPYDPYFNRPFEYQLQDGVAIIGMRVPKGVIPSHYRQIELRPAASNSLQR